MSKFAGLLESRKGDAISQTESNTSLALQTSSHPVVQNSRHLEQVIPPLKQRTKGKKGDPDYAQVTAYIKADTYRQTQIRLLELKGKKKEVSELLQELLAEWLAR